MSKFLASCKMEIWIENSGPNSAASSWPIWFKIGVEVLLWFLENISIHTLAPFKNRFNSGLKWTYFCRFLDGSGWNVTFSSPLAHYCAVLCAFHGLQCILRYALFVTLIDLIPTPLSRCNDWLRPGRSGDRIPMGRDFPPVQTDPGTHPPPVKWVPVLSRG